MTNAYFPCKISPELSICVNPNSAVDLERQFTNEHQQHERMINSWYGNTPQVEGHGGESC